MAASRLARNIPMASSRPRKYVETRSLAGSRLYEPSADTPGGYFGTIENAKLEVQGGTWTRLTREV